MLNIFATVNIAKILILHASTFQHVILKLSDKSPEFKTDFEIISDFLGMVQYTMDVHIDNASRILEGFRQTTHRKFTWASSPCKYVSDMDMIMANPIIRKKYENASMSESLWLLGECEEISYMFSVAKMSKHIVIYQLANVYACLLTIIKMCEVDSHDMDVVDAIIADMKIIDWHQLYTRLNSIYNRLLPYMH